MLDSLRKFASSWFGKLMLAFLLVGLAGFGISGVITNFGSSTVARVGNTDISTTDFQRAYNAEINQAAQRLGFVPTADQAMAFGIPGAALNRLANVTALSELADKMGLGASDERLGKMLREDPRFASALGEFDRTNFQRALQQNGFTEAEFLKTLKQQAQRDQIVQSAFADIAVPQAALDIVGHYTGDKRVLSYFVLDPNAALPPAEPTDGELAAYLNDHQGQYRTQATRTVEIVVLSPEELANNIDVSDAAIAAEYERTKATFTVAESREIQQVVLKDDAQQQAFEAGQADGKSFDELVGDAGLTAVNLGLQTKAGIADTELADAAFGLEQGGFTLVPGVTGMRAVTVSKIVPGGLKPLEEVRDQIAEKLKTEQARNQYVDTLDQIEELRAALQPMDGIASRFKLTPTELTITSRGEELRAISEIPAASRAKVAEAIFAADPDRLTPGVPLGSNLNVWFDLKKVEETRDQTVDEVRDALVEAVTNERIQAQLEEEAGNAVERIKSTGDIATAGINLNANVSTSEPINRGGAVADGSAVLNADVAKAAFDGPQGHVGYAAGPDGVFVVFKVDSVVPAEEPPTDQIKNALQNGISTDMVNNFVGAVRQDAGVRVSQGVLGQVIGAPGN